jgi:hypothetical protein
MQSAFHIYRGNKRVDPGSALPLIVVTATEHRDRGEGFSEHFIFTGRTSVPLFRGDTGYSGGRVVTAPQVNAVFTVETMLASEFYRAKGHLEYLLWTHAKALHRNLFMEGPPFEFHKAEEQAFIDFALSKQWKGQINEMFAASNCEALNRLQAIWNVISSMNIKFQNTDSEIRFESTAAS